MKARLIFGATTCLLLASCNGQNAPVQIEAKTDITSTSIQHKEKPGCDSLYSTRDKNGRVLEEGCFRQGKKHGAWIKWFYQEHIPVAKVGRGKKTIIYDLGIEKAQYDTNWYKASKQVSSLRSTIYFKPDSLYGKQFAYSKTGIITKEAYDLNSLTHGVQKIWSDEGNIFYRDSFHLGLPVYKKEYNPKKKDVLVVEEYYDDGKLTSEKKYDPITGKLLLYRKYKAGKLISEKKY